MTCGYTADVSTVGLVTPSPPAVETELVRRRVSPPVHRIQKDVLRRRVRIAGWVAFALWAAGLCLYSTVLYHHFLLGEDFGQYNQAWTLIGQGHLDPFNTVYGFPFVRSNFELVLWPLAFVYLVFPHPIVLLWIQDLSVAGTGLVTYLWVGDILERARVTLWPTVLVAAGVVIVTVTNPSMYETVAFDFHMEATAALFVVLAARDLWRGRTTRAWVFVAITLLCGTFSAVVIVGLGLSALLAGLRTRRSGILLLVTGVGWTVLVDLLHVNVGSSISNYAYLAGRSSLVGVGGMVALAGSIAAHPARIVDQLRHRLSEIWFLIRPYGVIGLASAWGFGVPAVVVVTSSLNSSVNFLEPFQNFAALPFLLVGTVIVLIWLSSRFRLGAVLAVLVGIAILTQALVWGTAKSSFDARWFIDRVGQPQAAQLQAALDKTPANAEVIATISVMGRFCGRESCQIFYPDVARPVTNRTVVFVLAPHYEPTTSAIRSDRAITYIHDVLHARTLVDADGIAALEWHAPPATTEVTIPTLSTAAKG